MFDFLKKSPDAVERDLEKLIHDVAAHRADKDFQTLYQMMAGRNVFVPADLTTLQSGGTEAQEYAMNAEQVHDQLKIRSIRLRNKMLAAVASTTIESRILRDGYVGMGWLEFLAMTATFDATFYGAVLQGKTSWVAFDRERIETVIKLGKPTQG